MCRILLNFNLEDSQRQGNFSCGKIWVWTPEAKFMTVQFLGIILRVLRLEVSSSVEFQEI